jgi:hypothetical protein
MEGWTQPMSQADFERYMKGAPTWRPSRRRGGAHEGKPIVLWLVKMLACMWAGGWNRAESLRVLKTGPNLDRPRQWVLTEEVTMES